MNEQLLKEQEKERRSQLFSDTPGIKKKVKSTARMTAFEAGMREAAADEAVTRSQRGEDV
jgi:hypothetical protein